MRGTPLHESEEVDLSGVPRPKGVVLYGSTGIERTPGGKIVNKATVAVTYYPPEDEAFVVTLEKYQQVHDEALKRTWENAERRRANIIAGYDVASRDIQKDHIGTTEKVDHISGELATVATVQDVEVFNDAPADMEVVERIDDILFQPEASDDTASTGGTADVEQAVPVDEPVKIRVPRGRKKKRTDAEIIADQNAAVESEKMKTIAALQAELDKIKETPQPVDEGYPFDDDDDTGAADVDAGNFMPVADHDAALNGVPTEDDSEFADVRSYIPDENGDWVPADDGPQLIAAAPVIPEGGWAALARQKRIEVPEPDDIDIDELPF